MKEFRDMSGADISAKIAMSNEVENRFNKRVARVCAIVVVAWLVYAGFHGGF
jgi:hypothetical protein